MTITRAAGAGALGIAAMVALPGCTVVDTHGTERVTGVQISNYTLSRLQPGHSTEADVLDLLGAPTRTMETGPGTRVFVYDYRRERCSSGSLFLVFDGSSREVEERTVFVELCEGVVERYWADGDRPVEPRGSGA